MRYELLLLIFSHLVKAEDDINKLDTVYTEMQSTYQSYMKKRNTQQTTDFFTSDLVHSWTKPTGFNTRFKIRPRYDFIIVGSGSAGSVIANRLSENPNWEILLLEAGRGENLISQVPLAAPLLQFTPYNWRYFMEYQPDICMGLKGQRMHWPRGKALGGSTVINYMIYTRGNKFDFDRWEAQGNPGWGYKDVLPYYVRSENSKLRNADRRKHGVGGYLSVSDVYQSELVKAFVKGGVELGLPHIDYNANVKSLGVSTVQATVQQGLRHSNARAFLHTVRGRPNLHMLTSAYVTKVLINPTTKEAYGVEFDRAGHSFKVMADKEVILSAGAFNSPQLLMLAGIGPAGHLQKLGIPVLSNLAVGRNLHDHLTFVGLNFLLEQDVSLSVGRLLTGVLELVANRTGPLTSLGGVEGIGYIKTHVSKDPEDIPDIELIFVGGTLASDFGLFTRTGLNMKDEYYKKNFAPTHGVPSWTIFPMLLHPKSIGWLELKSKNPYDHPKFYGNFFTDPEDQDVDTFLAAIRFIQKLANTKPFRKFGTRISPYRMPGCDNWGFDSDGYWKCALRALSVTLHHQVGTAKMGPPDDPTAVVNHELKVYGVGKLRVADCSIIPFALGAHTNAPSTMVGEKAADLIKKDWGMTV